MLNFGGLGESVRLSKIGGGKGRLARHGGLAASKPDNAAKAGPIVVVHVVETSSE